MKKRNKITYWFFTLWLSLGMVSTGIIQIIHPLHFLTIIGIWKLLGVPAVLLPKFPLVKEWAYAGFFFLMTGAILSHLAIDDKSSTYFGPALLLVLTIVSWYYRPADRKISNYKR
ncbi:DoxX family protein [Sphingobacterium sp. SG20118]|uniref:DoxX family protein n=1 Tax=Sphingobacterium sp. SG20118 TaxID=3367156 RepID=UPI0037DFBF98